MHSFNISKAADLPVICFHGSPGTPKDFNSLIKRLPQYTFDPLVRKNYPYYNPIRQLTAGDTNSILLGYSWGCRETLEFFLNYSDRIKGIALVSPYILHSEKSSVVKKLFISSTFLSSLFFKIQSSRLAKNNFISDILIHFESLYEKMEHQLISYASILRMVRALNIPLHIIYGKHDNSPHVNQTVLMIKKIIPNAIFHPIENGEHGLLKTHSTRIEDIIKSLQSSKEEKKNLFHSPFSRNKNSFCLVNS
jgi:pimeloyl-ACP methyl ester carboxylesterase